MPEKRTIIFLRHGDADKMSPEVFFGRTNSALNENGRKAAVFAAQRLGKMKIGTIYSSSLLRCVQTARLMQMDAEIKPIDGLSERDFGKWEGKNRADCRRDVQAWEAFNAPDGAAPEGESESVFRERVLNAYNDLLDESEGQDVILIVAHHSVICTIVADALAMGPGGVYHLRCAPGSLSSIDYVDGYAILTRWNA